MRLQNIYNIYIYIYKEDLAFNNLQWLWYTKKPNLTKANQCVCVCVCGQI